MTQDRTTINVSKEAHRKAQKAKEDGETWSDYLLRSTDVEAVEKTQTATVEVDGDSIRETIAEELEKRLDSVSVNVDMGDLDLEGSELSEDDVRTVVRTEIEKSVHERARQL